MVEEPWLEERGAAGGGSFVRDLAIIGPKCVRFHPTKQKFFVTGYLIQETYQSSETKNQTASYDEKNNRNSKQQPYILQYSFDNINYNISDSYYNDRHSFGPSVSVSYNGSDQGYSEILETGGFDITFIGETTDPKLNILRTNVVEQDGGEFIQRVLATQTDAIRLEEISSDILNEFFLDSTNELYQQYQSLINLPDSNSAGLGDINFSFPEPVDLKVMAFTSADGIDTISKSDLSQSDTTLYYNSEDERYERTSYPTRVYLAMDLLNENGLDDIKDLNYRDTPTVSEWKNRLNHINNDLRSPSNFFNAFHRDGDGFPIDESIFYFDVIQWGDEDNQLSNEEILESNPFFINPYNVELANNLDKFKLASFMQNKFKPMRLSPTEYNLISHSYTSPGVKTIKIIVLRYTKDQQWLIEKKLITKNIVVNDGNLKIQDFEIFGGSEYNVLPLGKNQIIVGGLSEDSKYVRSAKKVRADGFFDKKNILTEQTNNSFIDEYEDGLYGKDPGKIDLGNLRTFSGVKKLENHIGDSIDNSLITNIFIDKIDVDFKRDVSLELNPQRKDFLSLQNTIGSDNSAILIGDYELEKKSTEEPLRKKGVMNTPQIETDTDKQAI